ncbi:MAG: cpaB [Nevskia sp.]|nr:cpaB [Nevskia sp.]
MLAIILAFVGFRMSRNYAQNAQVQQQVAAQAPTQAVPQTLVVVATKPLLANEPIGKDSVALVPVQVAPKDYFANLDDVVNRTPLIDIDAGAPITPRFFKDANQLAKLIPAGDQALSLELNDVLGVGNFVHSGDIVDVLVYLKNDSSNKIDPAQARILLKDALVLAYDEHITTPIKDEKQDANTRVQQQQGRHQRTVVIAVPEGDVTRVMLGASLGELRLALHGATPIEIAAAVPVDATATNSEAVAPANPDLTATSASALPLSDAAKAKAAAAKPTDNVITAEELAAVKPKLKKDGTAPVGIQIYRGGKRQTVYP